MCTPRFISHNSLRIFPVLPQGEGLLPKWLFVVTAMAVFNTCQNFVTTKLTRKLYSGLPAAGDYSKKRNCRRTSLMFVSVTPLQARTFAVWTLMSAVVRGYAAYDVHNKT